MARIPVIDDDDVIRSVLREAFVSSGNEVVEASDGRKGLACHRKTPADLVVTDIVMPDQEGIETIVRLREIDPDLKIIAISGQGRTRYMDYLEIAAKFGADGVFDKPLEVSELLAAVRRFPAVAA